MTSPQKPRRLSLPNWMIGAAVAGIAVWAYYPTGRGLVHTWNTDPNYSQGFLIPLLAVGLLWYRVRGNHPVTQPAPRWGIGLLAAAVVLRGLGAYFFVTPFDHGSLLASLAGVCLLFGGRPWFACAWPALALLVFMFPLPGTIGGSTVTEPLQALATRVSTFALQTLGVVAAREGNVILLKGTELGVVEACSGLRMLMVFCALVIVTATVIPAEWPRKVILVVSAVPLALVCNVIRITAAGVASESLGTETGYFIFHDLAGWLMVPLAFLLLGGELFLLSLLFRPEVPAFAGPPASGTRPLESAAV